MYFRYGHGNKTLVKVGDRVKKGQQLGEIGTGGGLYSAHLHLDVPKEKLSPWSKYTSGMTSAQVQAIYENPKAWEKTVLPNFSHYGYKYLEKNAQGQYHPGADLNSGAGNTDLGHPFYSACDGVVVYVSAEDAGWGRLLVVEEKSTDDNSTPGDTQKIADIMSNGFMKDYGNRFDVKDAENAVEKYEFERDRAEELEKENTELKNHVCPVCQVVPDCPPCPPCPPMPVCPPTEIEMYTAGELIKKGIQMWLGK